MKKLGITAIVCAIIFLAFAVTGGICLGIGIANVAADSDLVEKLQTYGDDIYSIIENSQDHSSYTGKETFTLTGDCEAISLSGFAGEVTIISSPYNANTDYSVVIEYEGLVDIVGAGDNHFDFTSSDKTLFISPINDLYNATGIGIFNSVSAGKITIYIPQYKANAIPFDLDLIISDTVGEIYISGIALGDVTLNDTVGEITLNNIDANMLTCTDTIGEIHAEGKFNGISITDTIGECEIESKTALTIDSKIEGNIAEVEVSLPADSRLNFTVSSSMGTVMIDDVLKDNTGSVSFNISGSMGNVIVEVDD